MYVSNKCTKRLKIYNYKIKKMKSFFCCKNNTHRTQSVLLASAFKPTFHLSCVIGVLFLFMITVYSMFVTRK